MVKSSKGRKVKYSMDPRMTALLAKNKSHGHTEVLGMCLPLLVFVILQIIGYVLILTSGEKVTTSSLVFNIMVSVLFGFLIYELCKRGHNGWAWAVVFLPFFFMLFAFVMFSGFLFGAILGRR